ncbi:hypothetical protein Ciccas_004889 [Cichlidogyrus casuarinus]|uniref:Uncharacterized protein n=1 Tax=Cichlidogyrus casuarinus TaxID=1844966 RepID=A0ABD2QA80_9PLAT
MVSRADVIDRAAEYPRRRLLSNAEEDDEPNRNRYSGRRRAQSQSRDERRDEEYVSRRNRLRDPYPGRYIEEDPYRYEDAYYPPRRYPRYEAPIPSYYSQPPPSVPPPRKAYHRSEYFTEIHDPYNEFAALSLTSPRYEPQRVIQVPITMPQMGPYTTNANSCTADGYCSQNAIASSPFLTCDPSRQSCRNIYPHQSHF